MRPPCSERESGREPSARTTRNALRLALPLSQEPLVMNPVAVMGMPRVGDFPKDAEFGECEIDTCKNEIAFRRGIDPRIARLCVDCVAKLALVSPTLLVLLPSGQRCVTTRQAAGIPLQ